MTAVITPMAITVPDPRDTGWTKLDITPGGGLIAGICERSIPGGTGTDIANGDEEIIVWEDQKYEVRILHLPDKPGGRENATPQHRLN